MLRHGGLSCTADEPQALSAVPGRGRVRARPSEPPHRGGRGGGRGGAEAVLVEVGRERVTGRIAVDTTADPDSTMVPSRHDSTVHLHLSHPRRECPRPGPPFEAVMASVES
ncbi:hypothetical protein SSCG_00510 [Streptomyces clavuligerus]|nr:hypothetical protein SSCG_00510 [Streptomyces clavuligerus]